MPAENKTNIFLDDGTFDEVVEVSQHTEVHDFHGPSNRHEPASDISFDEDSTH